MLKKISANIPEKLYQDCRVHAIGKGIYEQQEMVIAALEAWITPPATSGEPTDPRLARVVRYLSQPGNLDRLEHLLRALVQSP